MAAAVVTSSDAAQVAVATACEQALSSGMIMATKTGQLVHAPFILHPSPIPRVSFEQAVRLAPYFNLLIDRVSRDHEYLERVLAGAAQADPFTRKLLSLYRETRPHICQPFSLGLHRHDYMIHQPTASAEPILQQVEMNTISAAFSSLGTTVSELHRFMAATFPAGRPPLTAFPVNKSDEGTARMLALAHAQYGVPNAVALFIVLATEGNLFDQRKLQFLLWKNHGIRSIRRTLHQVYTDGQLAAEQRLMLALPEEGESVEVAIAYYRSAYMPDHYQSELEWEARARIELSRAIKCPTLGYQLAGCKKIQQDLALPGVLERFFTADQPDSAHIMAELRSSFAGLYPLDGSELARHITQAALANPDGFVLKPQREGGGNNLYKAQLHEKLQNASDEELAAYILMSKIVPQPVTMSFVRDRRVEQLAGISELGTFAGFLGSPTTIIANETTGFLLRSKSTAFDDGGVAAGVAFLDSPLLTD